MILRLASACLCAAVLWVQPGMAADCKLSAHQVYEQASPSVVRIFSFAIDPYDPHDKVNYAVGTGFVIDGVGTVVTNYHVLLNSVRINLSFSDGQSVGGEFIAGDPILDIALVRPFLQPGERKPLKLAFERSVVPGEQVFAIGNPLGFKMAVSSGVVSSTDVVLPVSTMSWDEPFIQTDAAINPGNSGGPLLDQCGEVIGMNTLVMRYAENMGFAIPARILNSAVKDLLEEGRIVRPWIGISGRMADEFVTNLAMVPFSEGFMIETIEPGSAADKAGLRGGSLPMRLGPASYLLGGDIIKSVNGTAITDLSVTAAVVRALQPGDTVKIEYFRDGEIMMLEAVLPERPVLVEDVRSLYRFVYSQQDGSREQ